jgi:hypothetical protein
MWVAAWLLLQGADLEKRVEALDTIAWESADAEVKEIEKRAAAVAGDLDKVGKSLDLAASAYQRLTVRAQSENDAARADRYSAEGVRAAKAFVERAREIAAKAPEEQAEAAERMGLVAGHRCVQAMHDRADVLRRDPAGRAQLTETALELEEFYKKYIEAHVGYLVLDAASYVGQSLRFAAEAAERPVAADALWEKCFRWASYGWEPGERKEVREEERAHEVVGRSALFEIQARIACARQLKAAGGAWERHLIRAERIAQVVPASVPSLKRTGLGRRIESEAKAAAEMLGK